MASKQFLKLLIIPEATIDSENTRMPLDRACFCCLDLIRVFLSQETTSDITDVIPNLFSGWLGGLSLEMMSNILDQWITKDNIKEFSSSPVVSAVGSLALDFSIEPWREKWAVLIINLIKMGAPIHRYSSTSASTLLDVLFSHGDGPFESAALGNIWLSILGRAGVDVASYLELEAKNHQLSLVYCVEDYYFKRNRELSFSFKEPLSVSWDWFVDPTATASVLVVEFKYLVNLNFGPWDQEHMEWLYTWPHGIYHWHQWHWQWHHCDAHPYVGKGIVLENIYQLRFHRRRLKKAAKLARIQGFRKTNRIPGAWIE